MIKKILFLSFVFFTCRVFFAENIILDDVSFDKTGNYEITIHNLNDAELNLLKMNLGGTDYKNFTAEKIEADLLFGIILDNSGSMKLDDFFTLQKRMNFILNNARENDLLTIWKLNDKRTVIYELDHPDKSFTSEINKLVREGTYTRLYDAIIDSKKELAGLMSIEKYEKYFPALVILSDADDIKSVNKADDMFADNNGIPVYFFSYLTLPDIKITRPYAKLSDITGGKFLERPDEIELKKYLFDRNARYIIKFKLAKKDFKNQTITVEIKDQRGNSLVVDLKRFFERQNGIIKNNTDGEDQKNNAFGIDLPPLNYLLIGILIIVILLFLMFMFLRKRISLPGSGKNIKQGGKYSGTKVYGKMVTSTNETKKTGDYDFKNKSNDASSVNIGKDAIKESTSTLPGSGNGLKQDVELTGKLQGLSTEDFKSELTEVTGEEKDGQKAEMIIEKMEGDKTQRFSRNQKIIYRETGDLLTSKKYDRINLFHSEKTAFIDEAEKRGQEVYYSTVLQLKKCTADYLVCTGKMFLLLDEIVKINKMPFRVIAITFDKKKKVLNYKLVLFTGKTAPSGKFDLVKKFGKLKEIEISRKSLIYGTPDSIVEKMISKKGGIGMAFSGEWKKAEILSSEGNRVKIITNFPVVLDTSIEFKTEVASLKKINARIITAEAANRDYIFTIELVNS